MVTPTIAEKVIIEPTSDLAEFKRKVRDEYAGRKMMEKIGDDIIALIEKLEKGSYTISERRGEPVLNQLFPITHCEEYERYESEPEAELPKNFYVSLEIFPTHCSDYHGDTAYVPVVVFHVCSINNENMMVFNREISPESIWLFPDTILPSKSFVGRIAVGFSIGGY